MELALQRRISLKIAAAVNTRFVKCCLLQLNTSIITKIAYCLKCSYQLITLWLYLNQIAHEEDHEAKQQACIAEMSSCSAITLIESLI